SDVFRQDPVRLIRVFRHCQQLNAKPDFALQALIREGLPLLTRRVQQSPDANVSFRSILEEAGAVYPILSQMHELGVLGRFIPEFDALTCLVQHEFYHRYTADIHTLHAIRELDNIFTDASPL
ncbi:MAG TPA: bifunctional uridylyltransferase/uridylyl-removing protein, partial [Hyphomicrobiaceae bacterium]|nr:bifunctional uridylyltransferase/uridylyl-removing protein [Hyphomicrobiaceae bacterium]